MPGIRESLTHSHAIIGWEEFFTELHRGLEQRRAVRTAVEEIVTWFRAKARLSGCLFAGACVGGREALTLADRFADSRGVAMLVPSLFRPNAIEEAGGKEILALQKLDDGLEPMMTRTFRRVLPRTRVRAIVGELEETEVFTLKEELGPTGEALEIDVVPGIALHPFRAPAAQEACIQRLVAWVDAIIS
jgi:dienelactone hydrolase